MSIYGGSGRMSTAGSEAVDRFMALPRATLSARPGHRRARGVDAVLLTFDKKIQAALRQLAFERLDLEARRRVVLERLSATEQKMDRDPDVLVRLNVQLADNYASIKKLAKEATPIFMDALRDADVQAALAMPVSTEEDAEAQGGEANTRVWRRRLESHLVTRVDAPYRRITHDSPNTHGHKDILQTLGSARPEDGVSYFQRQQMRYGRGRRGSTSVAGAWEEVFNGHGDAEAHALAAAAAAVAASDAYSAVPGSPTAGGYAYGSTQAQHASASDASSPKVTERPVLNSAGVLVQAGDSPLLPGAPANTPATAPASGSSGSPSAAAAIDATSRVVAEAKAALAGAPPAPAAPAVPLTTQLRSTLLPPGSPSAGAGAGGVTRGSPQRGHGGRTGSFSGRDGGAPSVRARSPSGASYRARSPSGASYRGGGGGSAVFDGTGTGWAGAGAASVAQSMRSVGSAALTHGLNTDGVLPIPRTTLSATPAARRRRGVEALLGAYPRPVQFALRELALDVGELLLRKETMDARLGEGGGYDYDGSGAGEPLPHVLVGIVSELNERVARLRRMAGPAGAELILAAVTDPDVKEHMGIALTSEEDAYATGGEDGTLTLYRPGAPVGEEDKERAARVWRRRLDARRVQPARNVRGGATTTHDTPTSTGGRDLHNVLNSADPEAGLSYYQKQQLRYGRGRRGSTCIAGAWETVLGGGAMEAQALEAAAAAAAAGEFAPPHPSADGAYAGGSTSGADEEDAYDAGQGGSYAGSHSGGEEEGNGGYGAARSPVLSAFLPRPVRQPGAGAGVQSYLSSSPTSTAAAGTDSSPLMAPVGSGASSVPSLDQLASQPNDYHYHSEGAGAAPSASTAVDYTAPVPGSAGQIDSHMLDTLVARAAGLIDSIARARL